ncbi:hypothetical protein PENSPDRAFT_216678 [Peniophora sp. CONT]|nr:hypothetical protein PENSPDRAFT_216678 [Peniophora sp. CONT]
MNILRLGSDILTLRARVDRTVSWLLFGRPKMDSWSVTDNLVNLGPACEPSEHDKSVGAPRCGSWILCSRCRVDGGFGGNPSLYACMPQWHSLRRSARLWIYFDVNHQAPTCPLHQALSADSTTAISKCPQPCLVYADCIRSVSTIARLPDQVGSRSYDHMTDTGPTLASELLRMLYDALSGGRTNVG